MSQPIKIPSKTIASSSDLAVSIGKSYKIKCDEQYPIGSPLRQPSPISALALMRETEQRDSINNVNCKLSSNGIK
jgi:hypothetical protein